MLLVFSLGAFLGAMLATGVFISILMYQRHQSALPPSAEQMRGNHPTANHAP
jgi:hypothetical protein